jgi:hypothetical protein
MKDATVDKMLKAGDLIAHYRVIGPLRAGPSTRLKVNRCR